MPNTVSQSRRKLILAGISTLGLAACAQNKAVQSLSCTAIPSETEGPYPADGRSMGGMGNPPPQGQPPHGMPPQGQPPQGGQMLNAAGETPNFLARHDKVRSDLTKSSTGKVATGVPITLKLSLVNANAQCASLVGYALYAWHCTDDGNYSMYSEGLSDEDFLRGVAVADDKGVVTFKSIFPGCYAGRWPHIHFEIFSSLADATDGKNNIKTSQLALPEDICKAVYQNANYGNSLNNLSQISLTGDNVFGDGVGLQMAKVTGSAQDGYVVELSIAI